MLVISDTHPEGASLRLDLVGTRQVVHRLPPLDAAAYPSSGRKSLMVLPTGGLYVDDGAVGELDSVASGSVLARDDLVRRRSDDVVLAAGDEAADRSGRLPGRNVHQHR
jgi:hypothetical protein